MTSSGAFTSTRISLFQALPSKYRLHRLVCADIRDAIHREKQIKCWRREKKVTLIEALNPQWRDLSLDWHRDDHS
jgi:putative endonuclease